MIEEIDIQLKDWINSVVNGVPVSIAAPSEPDNKPLIGLYLMDLHPASSVRNTHTLPLQIALRYLVTVFAQTAEQMHRLLGDLVFAAMERNEYEVDLKPPSSQVWNAFGIAPRPCFFLCLQLVKERSKPDIKLVREPVVNLNVGVMNLEGLVVTPDSIPIHGARVELSALQLATHTDNKGHFRFPAIAPLPAKKQIKIEAKGHEMAFETEYREESNRPLIIVFNAKEI